MGRHSGVEGREGDIVCEGKRRGKRLGYLDKALTWRGSAIITDPKSQCRLTHNTPIQRRASSKQGDGEKRSGSSLVFLNMDHSGRILRKKKRREENSHDATCLLEGAHFRFESGEAALPFWKNFWLSGRSWLLIKP